MKLQHFLVPNKHLILDKKCLKRVLLLLPLHRENLTSYLSPVLGQYGIRNTEFLTTFSAMFNLLTKNKFANEINIEEVDAGLSNEELVIPMRLSIYKGNKYEILMNYPHIGSIFGLRMKKKRRIYKKQRSYRNLKKLYQFSILRATAAFLHISNSQTSEFSKFMPSFYKIVRNSLHRNY